MKEYHQINIDKDVFEKFRSYCDTYGYKFGALVEKLINDMMLQKGETIRNQDLDKVLVGRLLHFAFLQSGKVIYGLKNFLPRAIKTNKDIDIMVKVNEYVPDIIEDIKKSDQFVIGYDDKQEIVYSDIEVEVDIQDLEPHFIVKTTSKAGTWRLTKEKNNELEI